jgi:hypothetical protein
LDNTIYIVNRCWIVILFLMIKGWFFMVIWPLLAWQMCRMPVVNKPMMSWKLFPCSIQLKIFLSIFFLFSMWEQKSIFHVLYDSNIIKHWFIIQIICKLSLGPIGLSYYITVCWNYSTIMHYKVISTLISSTEYIQFS